VARLQGSHGRRTLVYFYELSRTRLHVFLLRSALLRLAFPEMDPDDCYVHAVVANGRRLLHRRRSLSYQIEWSILPADLREFILLGRNLFHLLPAIPTVLLRRLFEERKSIPAASEEVQRAKRQDRKRPCHRGDIDDEQDPKRPRHVGGIDRRQTPKWPRHRGSFDGKEENAIDVSFFFILNEYKARFFCD